MDLRFNSTQNNARVSTHRLRCVRWLFALLALMFVTTTCFSNEPSYTEAQVKALFLFNFTKYVEWPTSAFADTNAPIVIGVLGDNDTTQEINNTLSGRKSNGRPFVVEHVASDTECSKCHILFITSPRKHVADILQKIGAHPVLTVGENDQFLREGGAINFVNKDGKIRLEINLSSAKSANLRISSKLLSVADSVTGKQ